MTATHTGHMHQTKRSRPFAEGLTVFAAIMLMIAGVLGVCRGIMAVAEDEVFVTTRNYVFEFDLTGWGWVHLALGAVAVLVSLGLFQASLWAVSPESPSPASSSSRTSCPCRTTPSGPS